MSDAQIKDLEGNTLCAIEGIALYSSSVCFEELDTPIGRVANKLRGYRESM